MLVWPETNMATSHDGSPEAAVSRTALLQHEFTFAPLSLRGRRHVLEKQKTKKKNTVLHVVFSVKMKKHKRQWLNPGGNLQTQREADMFTGKKGNKFGRH